MSGPAWVSIPDYPMYEINRGGSIRRKDNQAVIFNPGVNDFVLLRSWPGKAMGRYFVPALVRVAFDKELESRMAEAEEGQAMSVEVSRLTRYRTLDEISYWVAQDNGEYRLPPVPCRECGLVWQHHPDCVLEERRRDSQSRLEKAAPIAKTHIQFNLNNKMAEDIKKLEAAMELIKEVVDGKEDGEGVAPAAG